MTYKNKYRCGTKLWRKFGWYGRVVYNEVYGTMIRNPGIFQPKSYAKSLIAKKDWEVICHNAACQAAWAARDATRRIAA